MQYLSRGLWVSDIDTLAENSIPDDVNTIISVCQDTCRDNITDDVSYEQVQLADDQQSAQRWGGQANYKTFEKAVDAVLNALNDGDVLVHCHRGRNRSIAVCATTLAMKYNTDFDSVLTHVTGVRSEYSDVTACPNELMRSYGHKYVWANSSA